MTKVNRVQPGLVIVGKTSLCTQAFIFFRIQVRNESLAERDTFPGIGVGVNYSAEGRRSKCGDVREGRGGRGWALRSIDIRRFVYFQNYLNL